jgi:hypothetical protein
MLCLLIKGRHNVCLYKCVCGCLEANWSEKIGGFEYTYHSSNAREPKEHVCSSQLTAETDEEGLTVQTQVKVLLE